ALYVERVLRRDGAGAGELLEGHDELCPPSTAMHCPVICRAAFDARKTATPFRSSSPPRRRSGVPLMTRSPMRSRMPFAIFVGKKPGQIAFTLMPCGPHSEARARVKFTAAPLDVL